MTTMAVPERRSLFVSGQARLAHLVFSGRIAAEAVAHNTLRAALTALGILFGVASVIAMLAIGNGAEQQILAQMRLLGTNTVIIRPASTQANGQVTDKGAGSPQPTPYTPGLTALDAVVIQGEIPTVTAASGEVVYATTLTRAGHYRTGAAVGVDTSYFRATNLHLAEGSWFTATQVQTAAPVAIIGQEVKTRFFTAADPIGYRLKVGHVWLTVVGVLQDRHAAAPVLTKQLGIRDVNLDVYVPLSTMLIRYRNRSAVTQAEIDAAAKNSAASDSGVSDAVRTERKNLNQLDEIVVQVDQSTHVTLVADVVQRILHRRHNGVDDFTVTVPELLLKQEESTKRIFNIVLGAIASISLLVGGIGIMNIMLASILERTKEIGVRRALGATQQDVLWQFLSEAVMISLAGGVAGIALGAGLSVAIAHLAHIPTTISPLSVGVAFGVSVAVGLAFGILPARTAARQDPIVSLRYE